MIQVKIVNEGKQQLPQYATAGSAGLDLRADIDKPIVLKPLERKLIPTGLKAYCQSDEWFMLANRSSNPIKRGLVMANSIGVIDSDYYGNPDNDGHFMFAYYNFFNEDVVIKKGDVIGKVIFQKYLVTDDDNATGMRTGGFGSTDK